MMVVNDHRQEVIEARDLAVERAMVEIGLILEANAKKYCAVDTGRLRNSITFATSTTQGSANKSGGKKAKSSDYKKKSKVDKGSVCIGTNVEYAAYVEMGTVKTKAQPFLYPSVTNNMNLFKNIIKEALEGSQP